ncbi:MAG: hypothetical protein QOI78_1295 [Actinomycetota bacterium]|nr:hypothetical protein [Actinomycetota bacterium]
MPAPTIFVGFTGFVAHAGVAHTTVSLVHVSVKTLEYNGGMGNLVQHDKAAPGTTVPA